MTISSALIDSAAPLLVLLLIFLGSTQSFSPQSNHCSLLRYQLVTQLKTEFLFPQQTARDIGILCARRSRDDEYYEEDFFDDDDYDMDIRQRRGRRNTRRENDYDEYEVDDLGFDRRNTDGFLNIPSPFGRRDGFRLPVSLTKSVAAGLFLLGIGLGVTLDSAINTNPRDLASRDAIDKAAPDSKLCAEMGASAMAFDQRVFVSFNPFNVYVAQADVKPACVLRPSNVVPILKGKKLINDKEVLSCKNNMNTWAFVGDLEQQPQLSCVYKSEDAQNEFLSNPKVGIGEDYLDDDRARINSNIKRVKDSMTDAQKQDLRRRAAEVPGLD